MTTNLPDTRQRTPGRVTPPDATVATVAPARRAGLHATNVRTLQQRRAVGPPLQNRAATRRRKLLIIGGLTAAALTALTAVVGLVIQVLGALGATGVGLTVGALLIVLGQRSSKPRTDHCPGPYHR